MCAAVSFIFSRHSAVLARGRVLSSKRLASASRTGASAGSIAGLGSDSSVFAPVSWWIPNFGVEAARVVDAIHVDAISASTWRHQASMIFQKYTSLPLPMYKDARIHFHLSVLCGDSIRDKMKTGNMHHVSLNIALTV